MEDNFIAASKCHFIKFKLDLLWRDRVKNVCMCVALSIIQIELMISIKIAFAAESSTNNRR